MKVFYISQQSGRALAYDKKEWAHKVFFFFFHFSAVVVGNNFRSDKYFVNISSYSFVFPVTLVRD